MTRPKAVGYIRVSSLTQAEDGYGLEAQKRDVRRCAKTADFRLVAIRRDEGVSGTKPGDERPSLAEALSMIEEGAAEVLLIPRLDRLARELAIQEAALAQVWRHGGRVLAFDQGEVPEDDPDDPMRTAMRQMMGVFAQLDRGMIVARLRRGKRLAAENGRRVGGRSPYGYRAVRGALEPDETEQEAIKRASELRKQGASYREIAASLSEEAYRPKRGGDWWPMQVRRLTDRAA